MPDTIITPDTSTTTTDAKIKPARSIINKKLAAELTLALELANTAEKVTYATALAAEGIDTALLLKLRTTIKAANKLVASAGGKTAEKGTTTDSEETAKAKLLQLLGVIQTRAKRKYKKAGDPQRAKYYIGQNIGKSRTLLESSSQAIIEQLASDTLPAMKPEDVPALEAAREAYTSVQTTQSGDQSDATTARSQLEAKVKEAAELRREIQYAADAIWPAEQKVNAGVRIEFKIPPDRAPK